MTGDIQDVSRHQYHAVIDRSLSEEGRRIVFGCTEIGRLAHPQEVAVPVFDTTVLYAEAAVAETLAPSTPLASRLRPVLVQKLVDGKHFWS